ncbi:Cof-type HAD-IIB family hydrolase [Lacticigenium naphthae]|uniref:Cof-type HAD-IIB family hydrolase n=1 Tax=Lacticigenium naphthae TaxID=515351 RepID=UPI000403F333|nr:Cof-type HAD-IIB family hydrolase [Lacticigenium naphthae]
MNKKLIALDLDGTTLNNESQITARTKAVLTTLKNDGHIISIATGRPYRSSKQYYSELNLSSPIVNFNGALCHNPYDDNWNRQYHKTLSLELAHDMIKLRKWNHVLLVAIETKKHVYVSDSFIPYPDFFADSKKDIRILTKDNLKENPTAISIFTSNNEQQPIIKNQIVAEYGNAVEVRTWGGDVPCLEIVAPGVQKALGVEQVAFEYAIERKDILAFGDEDNDFELIQFAGHGVAMKNGITKLKEIAADVTTEENNEDGLANYLMRYFNLSTV